MSQKFDSLIEDVETLVMFFSQTSEMLVLFNRFNVNFADKTLSLVHLDFAGNTLISLGTSFHPVVARDSISLLEGAQ